MAESVSIESLTLTVLLAIRVAVALRFVPFLGGHPMPATAGIALAVTIAGACAASVPQIEPLTLDKLPFIAAAALEVLIGMIVGIFARLAFSVLEFAGAFVGISSTVFLADRGQETPPFSRAFLLLGAALFLLLDGHHALITGIHGTLKCFPPGSFAGGSANTLSNPDAAIRLFASAIGTAALVSTPVFAAALLSDLLLGMVSRFISVGPATLGVHSIRAVAVQLAAIAVLVTTFSVAMDFIGSAMAAVDLCSI